MNHNLEFELIKISGETPESQAAESLISSLKKTTPENTKGKITILTGVNIPSGEVSDIDILVIGEFENCKIDINGESVSVKSFCTVIELKEHDINRINVTDVDVMVDYTNSVRPKNASEQNRRQKYSLVKFCKKRLFISNVLWLKSVPKLLWEEKDWSLMSPTIFSEVSFEELVTNIIKSGHRVFNGEIKAFINDEYKNSPLVQLVSGLAKPKPIAPPLLRRKIDGLISGYLQNETNTIVDNDGFHCIDGKAGTGKTFLLLQSALQKTERGYSCVLISYNNALVLDLKRLLSFANFSNEIKSSLRISTINSYISYLSKVLEWTKKYDLSKIKDYISLLWKQNQRRPLKDKHPNLEDFVFIDEAQDCDPQEKEILEYVFGAAGIVVAKSALQKIRRNSMARWGTPDIKLKRGLRQKTNITHFLRSLTEEMGISDSCVNYESIDGLEGGTVIIQSAYDTTLHKDLMRRCIESGGSNYDILILVAPQQVADKKFVKANVWRKNKIQFIDGTDTLAQFACSTDELIRSCRIYQYESCRGLEGWATVCYNFDEIIDVKFKSAYCDNNSNIIENSLTLRMQEAYQWSMMPLTRAMDTLVITIKDTNSEIANHLRNAAKRHPDFVLCKI